ncbi:hypothetical protein VNO78_08929 [Psophocarpus tetragonolobus]|uniref:Uncharacterized protein n=1 Tax=Psophocarpus tetragonolobus TaxID=3891 RepID=A0AAN9XU49_PSOTE
MDMFVGEIRVCRPLYLTDQPKLAPKDCIILCGPQLKHAALTDAQDPPKQAKHLKRALDEDEDFSNCFSAWYERKGFAVNGIE